ncbi:UNVERIFIED_CONTAM: NADH-ubiquinone oxidoreductase chain 4, partial [Sesamum angustifolium]
TTDLQISLTTEFSERRQIFLWIASFASFAVKVPMVPVHIWLPEAHVEAPTAGSVILAGIPLKLGTYGFLRFSIPMFPEATLCSTPFIYTPSAIAIIYTSSTTLRQIDLKKIIAYSSVAHMNLVTMLDSRRQQCRLFQKQKPLSAPGREWRAALRAATAAPALRKKERNRYVSDGVYIVHRAPKRFLGQLSSLIHRSNALGISWREKPKCSCLVRRLDAFPSLPGIVPHRKKERRAPARPLRCVQPSGNAQRKRTCTNDNSKRHTSAAYLPFRWHQRDPAKVRSCRGCSTPLRSDELNFVAFPPAKRMGAVPWVSFGTESEERPEE